MVGTPASRANIHPRTGRSTGTSRSLRSRGQAKSSSDAGDAGSSSKSAWRAPTTRPRESFTTSRLICSRSAASRDDRQAALRDVRRAAGSALRMQLARALARSVSRILSIPHAKPCRTFMVGGLENRFGLLGPTRVQIPPPPLEQARKRRLAGTSERTFLACWLERWPAATRSKMLLRKGRFCARFARLSRIWHGKSPCS